MSDHARLVAGSFVWTLFPFGPPYAPDRPGPARHVGYVLARTEAKVAVVAYTSSRAWPASLTPRGVIEFDQAGAALLSQRPFHIDLRCLARMPLTIAWFPDLRLSGQGVLAVADSPLRSQIQTTLEQLLKRNPEVIEMRGLR